VRLAWQLSPKNRFGLLEEATGVVCPGCGVELRIAQARAAVALAAGVVIGIVIAESVGRLFATDHVRAVLIFSVFLALFFSGPIVKRLVVLKVSDGLSTVDFPVERLKRQLSSPGSERVIDEELLRSQRTCISCGRETPENLQVCLHCGRYDRNA